MTQEAVVTKLLPGQMAEVAVRRTTACGGNCAGCDSCVFQNELKTPAFNRIQAKPGQKVLIESQSVRIFKAAFLVYVMPLLMFLLGYLLAALFELDESLQILLSFSCLLIGGILLVLSQKKIREKDKITFEIIEIL